MSGPVTYRIDSRVSRLGVRAFAGGALSAMGHNPSFAVRDFEGQLSFDPRAPDSASLKLTIRASSLDLTDNVSEKDRREIQRVTNEEVLGTATFGDIVYHCAPKTITATSNGDGQYQVSLKGDLTLHGVTRTEPVSARATLNGDTIRGFGEASLRQSDYGLKLVSVAGGLVKVKDEVQLTFDIVARK